MNLLLCVQLLFFSGQNGESKPVDHRRETAFRLLEQGGIEKARNTLASDSAQLQALPPREQLLYARCLLEGGEADAARKLLVSKQNELAVFSPWFELIEAETAIRTGAFTHETEEMLYDLAAKTPGGSLARFTTQLILMGSFFGRRPDEPVELGLNPYLGGGLGTQFSINAALLPRTIVTDLPPPGKTELLPKEKIARLFKELGKAPFKKLFSTIRGENGNERNQSISHPFLILLSFLSPNDFKADGIFAKQILPLLEAHTPKHTLYGFTILYTERYKTFDAIKSQLRKQDSKGCALCFWTPRKNTLMSYGVSRPPFFLLVSADESLSIIDFAFPQSNSSAFFHRLRHRHLEPR